MDRNRLMMIGAALAAVIVIVGGFFLGVQPQLKSASTARVTAATTNAQNMTLTDNLATLKSRFSKLDSLTTQLSRLQSSVPSTAASAAFITEINALAASSGVTVTSVTIGDAVAYAEPTSSIVAAPVTPTTTATASPSASASATPSASTAPAASTPTPPTVATSPSITAANFSDLPVTIEVTGTYTQGLAFLEGLRKGQRLFLTTSIGADSSQTAPTDGTTATTTTTATTGSIDFTFGGLIYALSDSATANQSAQSATSTASGTASDSSTTDSAAGN